MKLHRLSVAGFGGLPARDFAFGPGLNVICGPNESGKTTLQMALYAALYGFYDNVRPAKEADALQRRYIPWQGSAYAVSLDAAVADGRLLQVSRDFRLPRRTRTTVVDLRSGRAITADYPQGRAGFVGFAETHLGLDGAAFRGCAFVTQADLALNGTAGALCEVLGKVVTAAGNESSAAALERLADAQSRIGPSLAAKHTAYARARERVAALEEERQRSLAARRQLASAIEQRRDLTRLLEGVEADLALLQEEQRRLRLATLRRRLETLEAIEAERQQLHTTPAPPPFPQQALTHIRRWQALQEAGARLAATRAGGKPAGDEIIVLERRLAALDATLSQTPAVSQRVLDAVEEIRRLAAAKSAAQSASAAAHEAVAALAPDPSPPNIPAGRSRPLAVTTLSAGVGLITMIAVLAARLFPALALALGVVAGAGLAALVWSVNRVRHAPSGAGAKVAVITARLNVSLSRALSEEQAVTHAFDAALAAAGLPSGQTGLTALDEQLDRATQRNRLERQRAETQTALERARLPGEAAAQEMERLRHEFQHLTAALNAIGVPPGAPAARIEALERWRAADEAARERQRRLAELDRQYELAAADATPERLTADIQELAGMTERAGRQGIPATRTTEVQLTEQVAAHTARSLELRTHIARLSGIIAGALGDAREPAEIEEELSRARAALDRLDRRHRALALAAEELLAAQEEVHSDFAPRLVDLVSNPFRRLTERRYERIFVDAANLQVRVQPTGHPEPVEIERLSRGTRDQALLLLRLAVTELLTAQGERIPMFLDEPLAHCDAARVAILLPAIYQAALTAQVFLFTCNLQLLEPARRLGDVTVISLSR